MTLRLKADIVPMTDEHIADAARLERVCFAAPWSEKMLRDALNARTGVYFAAISDMRVCGYAGADFVLDTAYITNVAVEHEARRKRVATALISALIDEAKRRGVCCMTLEVRTGNLPAIELYRGFGFVKSGSRPRYYINPVEDADIMTLKINSEVANDDTCD